MLFAAVRGGAAIADGSAPGAVSTARARFAWDLCVQQGIQRHVPAGAPVWVVPKGKVYWQVSLGPMSAPDHKVLTAPRPGAYSLRVIADQPGYPGDTHCAGHPGTRYGAIILVVRRR